MGIDTRSWRPLAVAAALVLAISLVGCGNLLRHGRDKGGHQGAAPIVAATVNGKPIYISDVEAEATVRGVIREGEELDTNSDEFFQILEDLIETRLFAMEAESRQLDRNADVRHRLDRARELILAGALNDQIRDTALDEAAVQRMYQETVRIRRKGREVHLRDAVFASKEAAQAAKRRLDSGASTFEEIAYDLSTDRVTGAEGGDLGFKLPEDLPDGLRDAASATQVGQVAGPFQTPEGWHLLKVEERREEAPESLASLRPLIEQWLMVQEQRRLIEKLKGQARIERIIEQNQGVAASADNPAPESAQQRSRADARRRDPNLAPMGPGGIAGVAGQGIGPIVEAPVGAPPLAAPGSAPPPAPAAPPRRRPAAPVAPPADAGAPAAPPTEVPPIPPPAAKGDHET